MISKELLKKVRHIQIYTRHIVNDFMSGRYESVFKGRGIEFNEVREYAPGDDVRTIDWNVTARAGHPYIKLFSEERQLTVMLVVDMSSSGNFASVNQLKRELAAELSAVMALSAMNNNDQVGLILHTDRVEKFIPPKKGRHHLLRVIRELLAFEPEHRGTDISSALEFLNRVTTRKAIVFMISDFIASGYDKELKITSKRHDVVAIEISDPRERELPRVGMVHLEDAESGQRVFVDTSNKSLRTRYSQQFDRRRANLVKSLAAMGVDLISVNTAESYIQPIIKFFKMRARRR